MEKATGRYGVCETEVSFTDQDIITYLNSDLQSQWMEHSTESPLINSYRQKIEDLSCHGAAISPNALKELNARRLLSSNTLKSDARALTNWNQAQNFLFQLMKEGKSELAWEDLSRLNQWVVGGTAPSKMRELEIKTGAGEYLSFCDVPDATRKMLETVKSFSHPLRKAFEIYVQMVTIHPFENGNGRTARLAADFYLLSRSYLPVCFLNSYHSHMALVKNQVKRQKDHCFSVFLESVLRSYEVVKS